ncbi:MAG: hypothetical protein RLZZ502_1734, partial [Pseudomonadota bacterium]
MTTPSAGPAAPALPISTRKVALLLAMASMTGPFAVDMYLPAFHEMERSLKTTPYMMQLSMTVFFIGMAVMALFHGAISDFVGRRPVIITALSVYALASAACALADNIQVLLFFRLVQGLTSTAGFIVGRALVRDLFDGPDAQRLQSQQTMIFGIAPIVAPILGGVIIRYAPWQAVFWVLTGLATFAMLLQWRYLPEGLPPEKRHRFSFSALMRNYLDVFLKPQFQVIAFGNAFIHVAVMVYILAAPAMVMTHLKLGEQGFHWVFVPSMGGIMLGAALSGRLAGKLKPVRQTMLGVLLAFLGVSVNVLVNYFFLPPSVPVHVMPLFLYACGMGLCLPPIQLHLMDYYPAIRGACTSMLSFTQMTVVAFVSGLLIPQISGSALSLAVTQWCLCVIGALA